MSFKLNVPHNTLDYIETCFFWLSKAAEGAYTRHALPLASASTPSSKCKAVSSGIETPPHLHERSSQIEDIPSHSSKGGTGDKPRGQQELYAALNLS